MRACNGQIESAALCDSTNNELGWAFCATPLRRFAMLHAMGRRAAIPEFIRGASQADVAVLAVPAHAPDSAIDWWALEHAAIARGLGIGRLIVAVVDNTDGRLEEAMFWATISLIEPRLVEHGLVGTTFVPVRTVATKACCEDLGASGVEDTGVAAADGAAGGVAASAESPANVMSLVHSCVGLYQRDPDLPWYQGEPLLKVLEGLDTPSRAAGQASLRVMMLGSRREGARASLMGRVVQGSLYRGVECLLRPGFARVVVQQVRDPQGGGEVPCAVAGEYADLLVSPSPDDSAAADGCAGPPQVLPLSGLKSSTLCGSRLQECSRWLVELRVLELEEGVQPHVIPGFCGILYFGSEAVGAKIQELVDALDLYTQARTGSPAAAYPGTITRCVVRLRRPAALDTFGGAQLGRFVLRRSGHTVGVGKVVTVSQSSHESGVSSKATTSGPRGAGNSGGSILAKDARSIANPHPERPTA